MGRKGLEDEGAAKEPLPFLTNISAETHTGIRNLVGFTYLFVTVVRVPI
jgi:hypothetical protein